MTCLCNQITFLLSTESDLVFTGGADETRLDFVVGSGLGVTFKPLLFTRLCMMTRHMLQSVARVLMLL